MSFPFNFVFSHIWLFRIIISLYFVLEVCDEKLLKTKYVYRNVAMPALNVFFNKPIILYYTVFLFQDVHIRIAFQLILRYVKGCLGNNLHIVYDSIEGAWNRMKMNFVEMFILRVVQFPFRLALEPWSFHVCIGDYALIALMKSQKRKVRLSRR